MSTLGRSRLLAAPVLAGILAGLLLAAAPASAAVGTTRLLVPGGSGGRPVAHLHFALPAGYRQLVGALEGRPAIGAYRAPGKRCGSELEAVGRARVTGLDRRGDRLRLVRGNEPRAGARSTYLRIERMGHVGGGRWYVGPTWSWPRTAPNPRVTALTAAALLPAPRRFTGAHMRWVLVTISVSAACRADVAGTTADLVRAVRAVRILPGHAHVVAGVPTETA